MLSFLVAYTMCVCIRSPLNRLGNGKIFRHAITIISLIKLKLRPANNQNFINR